MDVSDPWFLALDAALGVPPGAGPGLSLGPGPAEAQLLLDVGKFVAEAGPQRMYALLTAFALGRALGRAEALDPSVDPVLFLSAAAEQVRRLA